MRTASPLAAVVALAVVAAGCGDGGSSESEPASADEAFSNFEQQAADERDRSEELAAPRWEPLVTRSGDGDATLKALVDEEAIQWRARWTCESGSFELESDGEPFAEDACPGEGEETAVESGPLEVGVRSDGPWRLVIEQQVDLPLREPPLSEIASGSADTVSTGRFYEIENPGRGSATVYRLPDDRLALRLESFRTSANTDLFVWLSESPRPRTTKQALASPYVEIAPLKSTVGDQNYLLPPGFDPAAARSVVIWCEPIRVAYTAASLRP